MTAAWLLATAALASAPGSAPGAAPGEAPGAALALSVAAVQLFPVVREGGRAVADLGPADFLVLDEGRPVELDSFACEPAPLALALVVDASESMEESLPRVREAALTLLERLAPDDRVGVYAFNHALWAALPPTLDRASARAALEAVETGGGTALHDALLAVVAGLREEDGRRAIVVFSDGADGSGTAPGVAARAAREASVVVYPVALPHLFEPRARRALGLLARETGGEVHWLARLEELERTFAEVLADLRAQYRLSYTPPPGPPGERRVEVRAGGGRLEVRCRRRYVY